MMIISETDVDAKANTASCLRDTSAAKLMLKKDDGNIAFEHRHQNKNWFRKIDDQIRGNRGVSPTPELNELLAMLAADAKSLVFPHLELVHLDAGDVLYNAGDTLRHVYFPITSIISLLSIMQSGASAEISVVGYEGIIGITSLMGGETASGQAVVLSTGHAYRLKVQRLRDECKRSAETLQLLLRYTLAQITQMAQNAACNRHHSIEQQLCRLLLMALDRSITNKMAMTHEQFANMLGVRREGISKAARNLRKLGIIDYTRGHITVLNRAKLEEWSCECYALVNKERDRLMPSAQPQQKSIKSERRAAPTGYLTPSIA